MPRGRLIFPFLVSIARLDTAATAADPDGAGPLVSGYDDEFREPVIVAPSSGSGRGQVARQEDVVQCFAQIEDDEFELLQMMASGRSPTSSVTLVFHFADLERRGLVDATTGEASIRINDRLAAIYDRRGTLVQTIGDPPGLYCTEAKSRSFGLGLTTSRRNLLVCKFGARDLSAKP